MGNIKQVYVVRVAEELMEEYPGEFSAVFADNKKKVIEYVSMCGKGTRNKIAGYITHFMRVSEDEKNAA